jgi:phage head maturation protease
MNHNPSQPLGVIKSLIEDGNGLAYESQIGKHALGVDFIKMVESGLISEHSIGFISVKKNQLKDNADITEITEIKLYEGSSLTAWGANPLTPLTGLKAEVDVDKIVEQQKAIEKFCKNTDATDETIEMLLLHSKQLSQYIIDLKAIQPVVTTEPDLIEAIQSFRKTLK